MKHISLLVFCCLWSTLALAQESLRPRVAQEFGKAVVIEAEFVGKRNSYHDQNLVKEPFLLQVFAVDGKALKPVIIEYRLDVSRDQRADLERPGVRIRFKAYETVYQEGVPVSWAVGPQQFNFALINILHIKPATDE